MALEQLMGATVYDCGNPNAEDARIYCHSRHDGKDGAAYLITNNSLTEMTAAHLPKQAEQYTLAAENLRSTAMTLNGVPLTETRTLSGFPNVTQAEGMVELTPGSCVFLVL